MTPEILADLATKIKAAPCAGRRKMVAFAGAPASGKSTMAEALVAYLQAEGTRAQCVPMDGFHLDNALLEPRGLIAVKGSPQTFDAEGFVQLIARIQSQEDVYYPTFDRSLDKAIAGSGHIGADCEIAVVEGNYLLFDAPVWRGLMSYWDFSIRLDAPFDRLESRLIQRWLDHGLSAPDAKVRALSNDIPNAKTIMDHALPADLVLQSA